MTWVKLKKSYNALCLKAKNKESFTEEWQTFSKVAKSMESSPSTGLKSIQDILTNIEKKISRDKIKIFDHGCGGGLTSMYFAALGYKNIYGVLFASPATIIFVWPFVIDRLTYFFKCSFPITITKHSPSSFPTHWALCGSEGSKCTASPTLSFIVSLP